MSDLPNLVADEMYEAGWTCDMHEPDRECDRCQQLYRLLAERLRLRGLKFRDEINEEVVASLLSTYILGLAKTALDAAFEVADEAT